MSSFNKSNILSSNLIVSSLIQNVDVISSQFLNAYVLRLNHINLKNLYFSDNKFYNNSIAISTSELVDADVVPKTVLM